MSDTTNYDAMIVGAGPVGLTLALALARRSYRVLLVEKGAAGEGPSFDARVLALTWASKEFLAKEGLWDSLKPFTTDILHVHVSQKGYMGLTQLHADEMKVPALGFSILASDLGRVLWEAAHAAENITVWADTELVTLQNDADRVTAELKNAQGQHSVQVPLLVGADGTQSKVRQTLQLPLHEKAYEAVGVIAKIDTEHPHQGWSFERFTSEGPVALLPMAESSHKAVMVVPAEKKAWAENLSDEAFITAFTEKMGERFGRILSVSPREMYPLKETYVDTMVKGRTVLMGNASHTQHPVAAQGLNLGLADIAAFLNTAVDEHDSVNPSLDLGAPEPLNHYAHTQQAHHKTIMGLTDGLIQIFQAPSPVVGHLRGLGLMAMEALPSLRKRFSKIGMGVRR